MADMRVRNAYQIRFKDISTSTRWELAKYLDVGMHANWEVLAEELGCPPPDIHVRLKLISTVW